MFFPLSLQYACRKASIRNVREKFPSVRTVSYDTGGRKRKFAHMSNESVTDYRLQFSQQQTHDSDIRYQFIWGLTGIQYSVIQFFRTRYVCLSVKERKTCKETLLYIYNIYIIYIK